MTDQEIFEQASALAGRELDQLLTEACGGDSEQRQRVEKLLSASQQTDSLLDALDQQDSLASTTQALSNGKHPIVGNYKLLHKLGEGGFGVVYMAEQLRPVRRKVALKIIKTERLGDAGAAIARFEAERQALAMMDHPNIAKVFDGGAIPAGSDLLTETLGVADRPFFVMELVNGVPITEYCDKNNLPNRERLELFITVCQAVQHAHQKGVIHRDLKPSNILVTLHDGKPVVKVIDFGVAKAINQQLTDKTLYTVLGDMIGTPLYMSPEQAERSGLDIDTRSDIYSLGVLLYELLTGTTPLTSQELRVAGVLQIQRCIMESEPPKPSTRLSSSGNELTIIAKHRSITPDKLSRELKGDLDWIVMKALDKDRSRRYDTAKGFANDVERFLNDDAVLARPPSTLYLLRKGAKRYKGPVTAAVAVFASLLLGLVCTMFFYRKLVHSYVEVRAASFAAENSQFEANRALLQSRAANYAFSIETAFGAWEMGSLDRLQELLESCRPAADDLIDRRGFEWRLLKQMYDEHFPELTFELPDVPEVIKFSPSGSYLAAMLASGQVALIDPRSQKVSIVDVGFSRGQQGACEFLDEEHVIVGGSEASAPQTGSIVWLKINPDRTNATETNRVRVDHPVDYLTLDQQERILFSNRKSLTTWRLLASGEEDPNFEIEGVCPSVSQNFLVTRSVGSVKDAQCVWVYDAITDSPIQEISTATQPRGVKFSDMQRTLYISDSSGIWLHKANTDHIETQRERLTWRRCGDLFPIRNGSALVYADLDGNAIRIMDRQSGEQTDRFLHSARVSALAVHRDGELLVSGSFDKKIKIWKPSPIRSILRGIHPSWWAPFDLGRGQRMVAFAAEPDKVQIYDFVLKLLRTFELPLEDDQMPRVRTISLSEDGVLLAASTRGERCYLWNLQSGIRRDLPASGSRIAISEDASVLVIAGQSGCQLFALDGDSPTGNPKQLAPVIETPSEPDASARGISVVAFSRDNRLVAMSGRRIPLLRIWDLKNSQYQDIEVRQGTLSLSFSPDGQLLAVAGESDEVLVYNVATGKEAIPPLTGNGYWLTCAKFSLDGSTLAAASPVGEIKFWRMPSGEPAGSMKMNEGIRNLEFSRDGDSLFWSSMDGDVGYLQASSIESL